MSYVYSGYYYWDTGRLYHQSLHGLYWSSTIYNSANSYRLNTYGSRLIKANINNKRYGNALRCVPGISSTGSLGARSYPLSYVYSGAYYWDKGRLYYQMVDGFYWSPSIDNDTQSYFLDIADTRLVKANSSNKRFGRALRCVAKY